MATKKISKPKSEQAEATGPAYSDAEILTIANATTTGYGLGAEGGVIVVERASRVPVPGAVTPAVAQTLSATHIAIPMRSFSEAQYMLTEIRAIVESDVG